jgi:hypothetical protein
MSAEGKFIISGTRLTKEQCLKMFGGKKGNAEIDRLVEQGYLVRLGDQTDPDEHPLPPQTNLVQQEHPHPHEVDLNQGERAMETAPKGVSVTPQPVITSHGPWDVDPATLIGKDVNELNVMIAERTVGLNEAQQFETPEEAIAWLSQDRVAEDAPAVSTG